MDGNPTNDLRLTETWQDPTEILLSPVYELPIPEWLPPGEYRVMVGLYNFLTGERLLITDAATGQSLGDSFELTRLRVEP